MAKIKPEFILTQDTYREKDYISVEELSKAKAMNGSELSSVVTFMQFTNEEFGSRNFPMLFATEGMGNVKKVPNFDFSYPIMGRPKTSTTVGKAIYSTGDKPGVGRRTFIIPFKDKLFGRQQELHTKGNIVVRVQKDPEKKGNYWYYTVQLWGDSASSYCPLTALAAGTVWTAGAFKVPYMRSRGVVSRGYLPGTAKNQTSLLRKGFEFAGNIDKKVMKYTIKAADAKGKMKSMQYYMDWELFQHDIMFNSHREIELWRSKYGYDSNGEFKMYDEETGIGIPSNAGIDEQIPNSDTYSFLTYKKLFNAITDVTFNVTGASKTVIDVYTGRGGMEDVDRVLKNELQGFTMIDSKQFSSGSNSWDMIYGGFFKSFRHPDGQIVNFIEHPMFNTGALAEMEGIHPVSGRPLFGHHFYILDRSTYDGEPNFMMVAEEGREFTQWSVNGPKIPVGFEKDGSSSDVDASTVHGMISQGILIKKPAGCYKLKCAA